MDFPVKSWKKFTRAEGSLHAMAAANIPQAEAFAIRWIEGGRPLWSRVYGLRRRIATIAVAALACVLFVHVMFGANGMIVYKQKRAGYESLRQQVAEVQAENDRYTQQIKGLQGDSKAIEKEAREQLGYAKPREYVYVSPPPAKSEPVANHSAKK